ncbi:F0F1 ATP synthase subunit A [Clostridium sp. JN-9]|uniref:F0F1 ATP synthase subunit A n=1 Tax=Clostridium sp. JN-9 TaxID=2507159 RepID=UPI000FFDFC98|nr:F0F1 ATP synthase subunit A [Clostridium sp. JN-9]QAT38982.1 F0F1 ATP synthase subunit A [Clostridium sp. JN-9]
MEEMKELFQIPLFGYKIGITSSILIQWIVIIALGVIAYSLTKNLKKVPDKKQGAVEIFVNFIDNLVKDNMGENAMEFVPYVGTLVIYLLVLNLVGLTGFKAPTEDFSVTLGFAAVSFFVIQANSIKKNGLISYFTGYAKPLGLLLPINILERIMTPVSLSLRLFGNMTAGAVILGIVYSGLGKFSIGIPIPLHAYFDVFDGTIQTAIFVMLTMINIKIISEE